MNRLVGDLLDVVSLGIGNTAHHGHPGPDARQLLTEAREALPPAFVAAGVTLTTDIGPGAMVVACDHDRIIQVLTNLLGNALKFTAKGGKVALSVSHDDSEVLFSVTDSGVGRAPNHGTLIYERFRRVDTKASRGLGLRLCIAKSIIDAHGGRIWVEARTGPAAPFTYAARHPANRTLERAVPDEPRRAAWA